MRIVVALGGNALLRRGESAEAGEQLRNAETAVKSIGRLAPAHELVVTHGNGPQVGLLALQAESFHGVRPYPLDMLSAETEGLIGYLIERPLRNQLHDREVVTLLTQTVVDERDPAFERPTKPIGPVYTRKEARRLASERGWAVAADGEHWRRVVPSPEPVGIVEIKTILRLVDSGVVVICVGGGGIPVLVDSQGWLHGVEAVIDKDLAASLLAIHVSANFLLMLTDVVAVESDWGTRNAKPIRIATPSELKQMHFASGSMRPKVEAACRFVEGTGGTAAIGAVDQAVDIVSGRSGTLIRN